MSQDQIFTLWTVAISVGGSIISVIIGAALSPWYSAKVEKIKRRQSLKPDLIKSIYIFFNLRKVTINIMNRNTFTSVTRKFLREDLENNIHSEERRKELLAESEILRQTITKNEDDLREYYNQLIAVESDIISLLAQIKSHYNEKKYGQLNTLIMPHINQSNISSALYDYENMSRELHKEVYKKLATQIMVKDQELNAECKDLIDELIVMF